VKRLAACLAVLVVLGAAVPASADGPGGYRQRRCIRYAVKVLDMSHAQAIRFCFRAR
jgi:hypothetical protein